MKSFSFKNKIISLIVAIISITIFVSFLSVNHFISSYIYQSDIEKIEHNIELVNRTLEGELRDKLSLAKSLKFNMMDIGTTKESAGFSHIVRLASSYAFDDTGRVLEQDETQKYITLAEGLTAEPTVSEVNIIEGRPSLNISIKHMDGSANFFTLDLSGLKPILEAYSLSGSYMELISSNEVTIFTDKTGENLIPVERNFDLAGQTWRLNGYIDLDDIQANTDSLNWKITMALLICAVIIIGLSVAMLHFAFKPLLRLKELVADLSQGNGDLTQRLSVTSNDEIGQISTSINRFIEQLQGMFIEVSSSSSKIDSAVNHLSSQSESNMQMLNAHTIETEQVITAIDEMSATAGSIAQSASDAAKLTELTNSYANDSKKTVNQAVQSVTALESDVAEMSNTISAMNQDTKQIGTVLQVIGDIAEQTNLLALNAAIEAARAGEQGRGFAVVADEVRALAARTQQSTGQINEMLSKLNNTSENVVSKMETTRKSCEATSQSTHKVMESLNTVTTSVVEINDLNTLMATSAEQQSHVTEEVSRNMAAIQALIGQLNDSAAQTNNISRELGGTSSDLSQVVGQFKVH
ncbi:methyl-accepting chemotaxis protein [Vibrio diazotrophicus]|jgi:methyl-accepting chemotaxis protein|uniref:Methyl-accepting chemotaxis protein n=1 Tax=Vibrio diazotrophicus TaxID=685 RepID=A0ABX4WCF3_VIBDI|nr:methyl-accepting chemotaxis protein [Vibrio diazotrophicus]PNI00559.1 methyl-accepting chemotaxis protein [Vibrio diazotrophicus]